MMDNQEIFLVAQRDAEAVDPTEAQLCQRGHDRPCEASTESTG